MRERAEKHISKHMEKHMKHNAKEVFIVATLILFFIPGICAIYSGVHRAIEKLSNPEQRYYNVVFSEEYPFDDTDADLTTSDESALSKQYLALANKFTNHINNYSGINNIVSPLFLYIYGKTNVALEKNLLDDAENPVIRLTEGYLTYSYLYSQGYVKYTGIEDFNEWLMQKDIPFLFVMPSEKSDDRYAVHPKGFPKGDYSEKENEYFKYLDDNCIPYLNSGEVLVSENEDFYSWFYKTDHHWNVRAGFLVAQAIAESLNTELELPVDIDALDKTHFNTVTYEKLFLGSQGKKATLGYVSPEDFEVYYPLFDTLFSIEIPTKAIDRIDSFENTLIESEYLKIENYYTNNAYAAFLYGDVPLIRIHNLNCKNGTRALMIKTSDANVVDTYLAFTVEYLDIIDPRHFDGSIRSFIEKTNPDVVLTCAYPSKELDNKMLDIK